MRRGEQPAPATLPPQKSTCEQTELARRHPRALRALASTASCTPTNGRPAHPLPYEGLLAGPVSDPRHLGDVDPNAITFEQISRWCSTLERKRSRDVAHKRSKFGAALWTVMRGMKIPRDTDPSAGVRNKKPKPRHARWSEVEAVRLVKAAWRHGYYGLARIIAMARHAVLPNRRAHTGCQAARGATRSSAI